VGLSSFSSLLFAVATLQGPGTRLTYRVRVIEPAAVAPRVLASGAISGPLDNEMRLTLRTDTAEVEALFRLTPFGDTVSLGADFFTRRQVGRSRRGLPLWEEDTYRRLVRLAWSDTARIYPFGDSRRGGIWVELILERQFAGGEGRAGEQLDLVDSTHDVRMEAVVRPRRARVILNLARGDTVSGPRPMDVVRPQDWRWSSYSTLLRRRPRGPTHEQALLALFARDRALALDADVLCLRVAPPDAPQPYGTVCGHLNNVARQLALPTGDTLAATFAWPGAR